MNNYWQVIDAGPFEGSSVYKNVDGEWTPMNSMWVKKDDTWVQVYQKPAFVKDRSKTIAFLGDEHIWGWNLKDSECIDNIIQQNLLTVGGGANRTNFHEDSNMVTYSLNSDDNTWYRGGGYDGRTKGTSFFKVHLFTDNFNENYTNTGVYSGFKGDKSGAINDWRTPEINISAGKNIKFAPSRYSSRLNICTKGTFKANVSKRISNYVIGTQKINYIVTTDYTKFVTNTNYFSKRKIYISNDISGGINGCLISYYSNNLAYGSFASQILSVVRGISYSTIEEQKAAFDAYINDHLANDPNNTLLYELNASNIILELSDGILTSKFKLEYMIIQDVTGVKKEAIDFALSFIPTPNQPLNNFIPSDGMNVSIKITNYLITDYIETVYDECESIDDGVKEFSLQIDQNDTTNNNIPSELYLSVTSGNMILKALQTGVHIPISPASEQSNIQIQRIARKYYAVEDYADDNVINEIKDNIMYKTYYDDAGIGNAVPTVVIQAGMNDIYRAHKKILNENGFLNKTMTDAQIAYYTTIYFSNNYENNLRKLIIGLYLTDGSNPHIPIVDVVLNVPFYPSNWFYWAYSTSNLNTAIAIKKGSAFNNSAINYFDETGNGSIIPNYKLLFKLHDELKRITYQLANEYYLHLVDLSTVFLLPSHFQPDGLYLNNDGAVRVANKYIDDLGLLQTYDYAYTSDKNKREYIYYKRKI